VRHINATFLGCRAAMTVFPAGAHLVVGKRTLCLTDRRTARCIPLFKGGDSIMTIRLKCACGKKLYGRDDWAGKRVKCPRCGNGFVLSAAKAQAAPAAERPDDFPGENVHPWWLGQTSKPRPSSPPLPEDLPALPAVGSRPHARPDSPPELPEANAPRRSRRSRCYWFLGAAALTLLLAAGAVAFQLRDGASGLGILGGPTRETPEIGNLQITSTKLSPPGVTFSLTIAPGKSGVSADKCDLWVCVGVPEQLRKLTPLLKKWKGEKWGGPQGVGNIYTGWWAGRCKLERGSGRRAWKGTFSLSSDQSLNRTTVPLSFVLLDDQGNASNQLDVWVDFRAGKLVASPEGQASSRP
jgi:hypothetical protein